MEEKELERETPIEPPAESKSGSSFSCSVCNFLKNAKEKLKSCLAKGGLFNKMSITEEEKKSLDE